MKAILFSILLVISLTCLSETTLITYDAPKKGVVSAPEFELEVNGQKIFAHNTTSAALAYFSFEGKVDVRVRFLAPVYNFDIRPKSRNIVAENYRNEIRFSLDKPENFVIYGTKINSTYNGLITTIHTEDILFK